MPVILPVKGIHPQIPEGCFIAPNATIVGDVIMGEDCSVWFNAVIRGDVNSIRIGNNVSVGHNALVHGCTVGDNVLIGMGAIVMDNVVIGENCIIAAGAVVLENTHVPPGSIYAGVPAKKVKDISPELQKGEVERIANNYLMYSSWFK